MEIIQLLIQINEVFHTHITRYKAEFIGTSNYSDVTVNQLVYLEAIATLGSPTVSQLAGHLKISRASASIGVAKLIAAGLAVKHRSADDSRVQHLALSKEGGALIAAEVKALSAFAENITGALSDEEIETLAEIFRKVLAHSKK